jgi:hypothetical protein
VENWQAREIYMLHQTHPHWDQIGKGKTAIAGFMPVSAESLPAEEQQLLRILAYLGWKDEAAIINLSLLPFSLSDLRKFPGISRVLLFGVSADFLAPGLLLPAFSCVHFQHLKLLRACSLLDLSENKNREKQILQPALEALKS